MSDSTPESRAVTRLPTAEEREGAVRALTEAFSKDAIAIDEFERRVAEVYDVQDSKALQAIIRDLPAAPTSPEATNLPVPVDHAGALVRPPAQKMTSVLSSIERRVTGPVPEVVDVKSIMGSMELDFRRAEFPPGVTEIRVEAIMGSVEIELPDHVEIQDEKFAFLGNFSIKGRKRRKRDRDRDDQQRDAPVVRLTGRSILASVEVDMD
ncbi:MAG: LiaF domain-containing protein [Gemmatimonadota bacterium]